MVKKLALLTLLTCSFSAYGQSSNAISGYLAARTNFAGVGAARIGYGDWEFGMFAPGSWAINKKMKFGGNYYAVMGLGAVAPLSPAFVAGAGCNFGNWVGFGIRGELYALQGLTGYSQGAATLGLSWNY